jgi:hypothetical protein
MLPAGVQEGPEKPGVPLKDCGNDDAVFRKTFMLRCDRQVMAVSGKHPKSFSENFCVTRRTQSVKEDRLHDNVAAKGNDGVSDVPTAA